MCRVKIEITLCFRLLYAVTTFSPFPLHLYGYFLSPFSSHQKIERLEQTYGFAQTCPEPLKLCLAAVLTNVGVGRENTFAISSCLSGTCCRRGNSEALQRGVATCCCWRRHGIDERKRRLTQKSTRCGEGTNMPRAEVARYI